MTYSTLYLYTDASFSKATHQAVSGYLLFETTQSHEAGANAHSILETSAFKETTNIRAEFQGMLVALEKLKELQATNAQEKAKIKIYTDCQSIIHLLSRRKKLETSGFISKRMNELLPNADLYQKFFTLFDQLNPEILWVKGHSPNHKGDLIRENFRCIDKLVRKTLRAMLNKLG